MEDRRRENARRKGFHKKHSVLPFEKYRLHRKNQIQRGNLSRRTRGDNRRGGFRKNGGTDVVELPRADDGKGKDENGGAAFGNSLLRALQPPYDEQIYAQGRQQNIPILCMPKRRPKRLEKLSVSVAAGRSHRGICRRGNFGDIDRRKTVCGGCRQFHKERPCRTCRFGCKGKRARKGAVRNPCQTCGLYRPSENGGFAEGGNPAFGGIGNLPETNRNTRGKMFEVGSGVEANIREFRRNMGESELQGEVRTFRAACRKSRVFRRKGRNIGFLQGKRNGHRNGEKWKSEAKYTLNRDGTGGAKSSEAKDPNHFRKKPDRPERPSLWRLQSFSTTGLPKGRSRIIRIFPELRESRVSGFPRL